MSQALVYLKRHRAWLLVALTVLLVAFIRIRLREDQPGTTWAKTNPGEYGFYANVNPAVDHPRWSQAKERRIGEIFKRDTLMFNGYGDFVASMYKGMDLRKDF